MQSNILVQVELSLKEQKFNIDIEKFMEFFWLVKQKWIFPDAVHHFTKADIVETYHVLDYLTDMGYLEQYFEIYCPNCNRFIGRHYKTYFELPEVEYCPQNDCELTEVSQNAVIIYRVIVE